MSATSGSSVISNGGGGGGVDYSTTEQDTGLKSVGEKTIYQKSVAFGLLPETGNKVEAHGVTGIDLESIVFLPAAAYSSGVEALMLPYADASGNVVTMRCNATNILVDTNATFTGYGTDYFTIQYTKS